MKQEGFIDRIQSNVFIFVFAQWHALFRVPALGRLAVTNFDLSHGGGGFGLESIGVLPLRMGEKKCPPPNPLYLTCRVYLAFDVRRYFDIQKTVLPVVSSV